MFEKKYLISTGAFALGGLICIAIIWWERTALAEAARPQAIARLQAILPETYGDRFGPEKEAALRELRIVDVTPDLIVMPRWMSRRSRSEQAMRPVEAHVEVTAMTGDGDLFVYRMRFVDEGRWKLVNAIHIRGP